MSAPKSSKSRLFLLELTFMIFFFAAAGAVCVQIFAKAHTLSQDSSRLTAAVNLTQSTISILESTGFNPDSLEKQWPEGVARESAFILYLDDDWNNCKKSQGIYLLTVEFSRDILTEAHISVSRLVHNTSIYELVVNHYEEAAYET